MALQDLRKPSLDEWMYWSQVAVDRLTTIVGVFNKPPYPDVFMPGNERQFKVSQTVAILRSLHTLTDENDVPMPHETSLEQHEEQIIAALQPLFGDVLRRLPSWSGDMQKLLKSPWYDQCRGKIADELFRGPDSREGEGIGSGMVENGRLPEVIRDLLEREQTGSARAPSSERPPSSYQTLRREELARHWGRRNSSFLRSAGRVD
jgi:hypothetical protein